MTSTLQTLFNEDTLAKIDNITSQARKIETGGHFDDVSIYLGERYQEPAGSKGIKHRSLIIVTPDNQMDIKFMTSNDKNTQAEITHIKNENTESAMLAKLHDFLNRDDFEQTMTTEMYPDDIRHDDMFKLKMPAEQQEAIETYDRINESLSTLFKPAFHKIVEVNSKHPKTHSMSAQLGGVSLATMDMAGRFMMTLQLENKSQITFGSASQSLDNGPQRYEKANVTSYQGTEKEFITMVADVTDAIRKTPDLSEILQPKSVVFAGQVIS